MALRELEKKRIEKIVGRFCNNRVPAHLRKKIKLYYVIRGNNVKIIESRTHWQNKDQWSNVPIARLKYEEDSLEWQLFCTRSNGRWENYPNFVPTKDLKQIVNEIDKDPYKVFWG